LKRISSASISARDHRNLFLARSQDLGVVALHGRGCHHGIAANNVLGRVTDKGLDAQAGQAAQRGAVGQVGA
jgi:hypothetical protein